MTSLVTGATGFLGRHLVGELLDAGAPVRALVREGTDERPFRLLGVEVVVGDVRDVAALHRAAAGCDRIYHLAGVVSHRRRDRRLLESVNVDGTRHLVQSADPGTRIVHVSSIAALGPVRSPGERADEHQLLPANAAGLPYAATKHAGERVALEAAARGLDVVVANPGFLLGPGDVHRVSTWPVSAYLRGRLRFTTPGGLSFVDARDVARGLLTLADRGRSGERTILAAEQGNRTWREFFELVGQVAGVRRRTIEVPSPLARAAARLMPWLVAPDEVAAAGHYWFVTAGKAQRELDFATRPLAETLADTIADHERESPVAGAFRGGADDGTRTHDLLHGKQTL